MLWRWLAVALYTSTVCAGAALGCTAVDVMATDKSVVAGRAMEWAFDMQWTLVSVPKGTALTLSAPPSLGLPAATANTQYAVVGVSAGVIPGGVIPGGVILEGQNSAGLDRSGAGVVVEYVGGALRLYDNTVHVLTNAPTYDWHLLNVRNYLNLSTMGVQSQQIGSANVTALGQGGGVLGIPGDYTPPARFVRAAFMRHNVTPPADAAVQTVGHILNTVDIPLGIAQSRDGSNVVSDYTQWVAIKDLTNNRLMISDYDHRLTFLTLDLDPIFAQAKPTSVEVGKLPYPAAIDATKSLLP
jgi:choloylglycine hydrolase